MDSATQLLLGAAVGYAVAGKTMGKKALLWGAAAGTLPDLDFIPTLPFNNAFIYLKIHRGFSHSLLFCLLPLLFIKKYATIAKIFFWGLFTHILLDCFTTWGTQVFWPFDYRVAWNTIFIIDPLYTVPLLITIILTSIQSTHTQRRRSILIGLILSSLYLVWTLSIKGVMHYRFHALFKHHNIHITRMTTRPSAFNSILWSATAETDTGYFYGMISLFDQTFQGPLYFVEKNHALSQTYQDPRSQTIIGYTKGYYRVETIKNGIRIHDLRYGFLANPWTHGEQYVFSYDLVESTPNPITLYIHNPRPQNRSQLFTELWTRLKGI